MCVRTCVYACVCVFNIDNNQSVCVCVCVFNIDNNQSVCVYCKLKKIYQWYLLSQGHYYY